MQVGGAADVPGDFDFVTLVHVLEHVPEPAQFLASLGAKLVCGGNLMVEVPHYVENSFDLLIVDHSTHFSAEVLRGVAARGGYEPHVLATDWVAKELTLVAELAVGRSSPPGIGNDNFLRIQADLRKRILWGMAAHRYCDG